uniref:RNase H type-1 domain-containing protein n=1 Tax=Megaselia scalaris TaxID=36166 RepID=T1H4Z0_MEGSC
MNVNCSIGKLNQKWTPGHLGKIGNKKAEEFARGSALPEEEAQINLLLSICPTKNKISNMI